MRKRQVFGADRFESLESRLVLSARPSLQTVVSEINAAYRTFTDTYTSDFAANTKIINDRFNVTAYNQAIKGTQDLIAAEITLGAAYTTAMFATDFNNLTTYQTDLTKAQQQLQTDQAAVANDLPNALNTLANSLNSAFVGYKYAPTLINFQVTGSTATPAGPSYLIPVTASTKPTQGSLYSNLSFLGPVDYAQTSSVTLATDFILASDFGVLNSALAYYG